MNIAAYIRINAAIFWMLPLATAAAALPLDEALWVEVNPLGGVFTNGTYECRGKNVQVFARAAGFGISSNVTFSADFTPGETGGTMWKTAAIALEEAPNRYWHVALVESPPPVNWRTFELSESAMASGRPTSRLCAKQTIASALGKTGNAIGLR